MSHFFVSSFAFELPLHPPFRTLHIQTEGDFGRLRTTRIRRFDEYHRGHTNAHALKDTVAWSSFSSSHWPSCTRVISITPAHLVFHTSDSPWKMPLWPFRRKTGRKRSRSGSALSDGDAPVPVPQAGSDDRPSAFTPATRTASQKKQRTEQTPPNALHRQARTYSFSPGRNDSIRAPGRVTSDPPPPRSESPQAQSIEDKGQDAAWPRVPTLHKKNSDRRVLRRKSTKRKRKDPDREAEIKAMSHFVPARPAVDSWPGGRPIRAESKRAKAGITNAGTWSPTSDVSLPFQESIHSTMSSDSEHASYKISALEALTPRPTLRYAATPRRNPSTGSVLARTSSQRRKLVKQEPIPEATLKAHKRIDSLADDLDAAGLRELMERDKRRRERKRQREQERIERYLSRCAEKQKEAEAEASARGTPSPQNLERGVMGREVLGLGIDTTSAVVTSSRRRPSDDSIQRSNKSPEDGTPVQEPHGIDPRRRQPEALSHFYRTDSTPRDPPTFTPELNPPSAAPSPGPEDSKPLRMAFLRSRKSRSRTTLASDERRNFSSLASKSNDSVSGTKNSETSGRGGKRSLSALFRWGTKSIRKSSGPSSFSNTSREEMQAAVAQAPAPAHAQAQAHVQVQVQALALALARAQAQDQDQKQKQNQAESEKLQTLQTTQMTAPGAMLTDAPSPSTVGSQSRAMGTRGPKRTRSRFREDLPEMPISPPESRVASPEAEVKAHEVILEDTAPGLTLAPAIQNNTPTSKPQSARQTNMQQTSAPLHQSMQDSPQPHSISLASIDSEGSWLSGKLGKRSSSGMGMRDSLARHARANRRRSLHSTSGTTEDELVEDEYLSNLATPPRERQPDENGQYGGGRRWSEEGRPSSDDDELANTYGDGGEMSVGTVKSHHPQIHRQEHQASLMKSREGLVNEFDGDRQSTPSVELDSDETSHVGRATSVDFGRKGHVRHVSAGSAKLLDMTPRATESTSSDPDASHSMQDDQSRTVHSSLTMLCSFVLPVLALGFGWTLPARLTISRLPRLTQGLHALGAPLVHCLFQGERKEKGKLRARQGAAMRKMYISVREGKRNLP
ncbi:hypothetical protein SODALDRAFT_355138 [Sodiomyces alkalinus F11]|uniref:Uncharacterized protein n=1 Tax=Sodiomyces alkalinus (strain CBS 110278 / VKM F-3762 / F11) TaxID=1314773 RepID=A0A3N2Q868_SODAK|nr:hypothetical protein SODALDRAFT_355138 [Sodiomyces alkalinus F11]ROT42952.1 hypothetical protein SODALDRAFT_355138 [Sodiomyces alkalinus F11]